MNPRALIGIPFQFGADGPAAFDCWGLVKYVRREAFGLETPVVGLEAYRDARMAIAAIDATRRELHWLRVAAPGAAGDVAGLARRRGGPLHHVGIVLDGGLLHAYQGEARAGGSVLYSPWERLAVHFPTIEVYRWPS
jgi:cell wall-associated NlpC family hydrolase